MDLRLAISTPWVKVQASGYLGLNIEDSAPHPHVISAPMFASSLVLTSWPPLRSSAGPIHQQHHQSLWYSQHRASRYSPASQQYINTPHLHHGVVHPTTYLRLRSRAHQFFLVRSPCVDTQIPINGRCTNFPPSPPFPPLHPIHHTLLSLLLASFCFDIFTRLVRLHLSVSFWLLFHL